MSDRLTGFAKTYKDARDRSKILSEQLSTQKETEKQCVNDLLELMVEEGVKSIKIDGVGLLSMKVTSYLSCTVANQEILYPYLRESGNGGLFKETINPKTLTAFLNEHLNELVRDRIGKGMDEVDARANALAFLSEKGASYFTDRGISLRAQ